jgi:hypothetical protein
MDMTKQRFSEAWEQFTREVDLSELNLDPDEIFAGVRDDDAKSASDRPPVIV